MLFFKKKEKELTVQDVDAHTAYILKVFKTFINEMESVGYVDYNDKAKKLSKMILRKEVSNMTQLRTSIDILADNMYFCINPYVWGLFKSDFIRTEKAITASLADNYGESFKKFQKQNNNLIRCVMLDSFKNHLNNVYKDIVCKVLLDVSSKKVTCSIDFGSHALFMRNLFEVAEKKIGKLYTLSKSNFDEFKKTASKYMQIQSIEQFYKKSKQEYPIITSVSVKFNQDSETKDIPLNMANPTLDKKDLRRLKRLQTLVTNYKKRNSFTPSYVTTPIMGITLNTPKGNFILNFKYVYCYEKNKIIYTKPYEIVFSQWVLSIFNILGFSKSAKEYQTVYSLLSTAYNCKITVLDSNNKKM